jgi:hypothetical protein
MAAAAEVSNSTKLAPGFTAAITADSVASNRAAASQNPQKPARRASQAPATPAASSATDAAARFIGSGCDTQEAPSNGGTLPTARPTATSAAHSATPDISMPTTPAPPHMISRFDTIRRRSKIKASASNSANTMSAAGSVPAAGQAMSPRA